MKIIVNKFFLVALMLFCLVTGGFSQSLVFQNHANMITARGGVSTTTDGNYIYVSNGFSGAQSYTTMLERYHISTNSWSTLTTSLISKRYSSSVVFNNELYIINGDIGTSPYNNKVEIVNLTNGTITFGTDNPYPAHSGGIACGINEIYVFGGSIGGGVFSNRLYKYEPSSGIWTRLADMPTAKQTRGEIINGKLYTIGGFNGSASTRIDIYDIATDTWSFAMDMPLAISAFDLAVYANRIWVIGEFTNLTNCGSYDINTNTYQTYNNNMIGRRHAGAESINGKLYAIGGSQSSATTSSLNSIQSADLVSFLCGATVSPEICMITVDSLSINNIIYWDKSLYPMADSFIVYRDTANNNYAKIGSVSKNAISEFVDTSRHVGVNGGDPNVSSWRYKISIIDTCGNESYKGPYHQTMFFQLNSGNFAWSHYLIEGQSVPVPSLNSYYVKMDTFALTPPAQWTLIQSLSASSTAYTYPGYSTYQSTADWRVETNWNISCNPTLRIANEKNDNETQTLVVKSKSNIKNTRTVGIKSDLSTNSGLKVYPNPANDAVSVEVPVPMAIGIKDEATITIENMLGQVVYTMQTNKLLNSINTSNLNNGVYLVKIKSGNQYLSQKLIIQK